MKTVLVKDLKFKSLWQYENAETGCYYKSGIIPGKVLCSSTGGIFDLFDAQELEKVLERTYAEGDFQNRSYIRILDFRNLKKITFRARQHYIKIVKHLNLKFNCHPKVTYICTANHWLKATLLFAEKFLNQKFVSVSNVDEAFEMFNNRETLSNNQKSLQIETEETITIRKEEIDIILQLTSSAVWGATDSQVEQYSISDVSPLNQLYQAVKVMTSDLEEILNNEKIISDERNSSLLQQKLLVNVSFEFTKLGKFEDKINNAIRLIGKFTKVSRVYIFEDFKDGKFTRNIFEWCNDNIKPEINNLQELPYEIMPSWKKILIDKGELFSENISELPQDLRVILEPQGIKSILILPIYIKNQFFGFIGFDECERNRKWDNSEVELLKTIANIISTVFEQRKTERKIFESKVRFQQVAEYSDSIVWEINENKEYTYVNAVVEKLLGYKPEEFIGKSGDIHFAQCEGNEATLAKQRALLEEEGKYSKLEFKLETHDGNFIWVSSSGANILNDDGKVIGRRGISMDITDRKKAQSLLLEAKVKAENADSLKSTFLAQMSHEIRTPINSIVSLSSLVEEELEKYADDDIKTCFNLIKKSGDRIVRTTDSLLNLSEIVAGTYEARKTNFDLVKEVFSKLLTEYQLLVSEKGLEFNLNVKTSETNIVADSYSVNQIFYQLVDNAIKYTDKGEISITVYKNKENNLAVEVTDSGIGISEEYLPKLFASFSQEDMGYTRKYEGNGVGLTLVREYCKLNNATIEVESVKGEGSTFRVVFET